MRKEIAHTKKIRPYGLRTIRSGLTPIQGASMIKKTINNAAIGVGRPTK
jgi:hypothetical protein